MKLQHLLPLVSLALASPLPLITRQLATSETENQLTDGTPCRAVTVIFARGTSESGNVGSLAGPPFFSALSTAIGANNLAVQGVDYAASIPGFLEGGDPQGAATMAQLVGQAQTQCPSTKVVMSGYSQGGQVVHLAANQLSAQQSAGVNSVVIFGDPDDGSAVGSIPASKTLVICHTGDNICQHGDLVLEPHLTYSQNAGQAATFVQQQTGAAAAAA